MDNLNQLFNKLFKQRTEPLLSRFNGLYRAIVVETNDSLNVRRVKFKCPDLHDSDLSAADCPWAVPSPEMGSKRCGSWVSPCIGDWVWIDFERGHPYGPVWVGFATPTRHKYYPLSSVNQPSPVSVNDQGLPSDAPNDFNSDYLPKDGRPMSFGRQDRYGNLDISSAIGFFPTEHNRLPPPPDLDPLNDVKFRQASLIPIQNNPDAKFMARITKYGTMLVMGDQGYTWKNEFTGDVVKDDDFEVIRWKYIQRLINEDTPTGGDQRNYLVITRYGHKFEMRDTGWAQPGPFPSKSRIGEYGSAVFLSSEDTNDFRWIKWRTKGGWLLQAYDKGFDPQNDDYISRNLIDEVGPKSDQEDVYWADRDARQFRIVGRYGYKIVIDERGTDPSHAQASENPRGNGILIKGRRTPGCKSIGLVSGNPCGFYFEFNENDDTNHTTWGTPLGSAIEMNDATEYMALCVGLGNNYARPWRGIEENEFLIEPTRARNPETNAYHLVFDHENEYLRLKTRGGSGVAPMGVVNPTGVDVGDLNQGLEARDGSNGDGPWVEIVDSEHRGLWLSRNKSLSILRSKQDKKLYVWLDDDNDNLVIYNGEADGKVQIYSSNDIEVVASGNITINATDINFKATNKIRFQAAGTKFTIEDDKISTDANIYGNMANIGVIGGPQPGGDIVNNIVVAVLPDKIEPTDRGAVYNVPSVADINEIEHRII